MPAQLGMVAELLYLNKLSSVYYGETGVRMLRELARSYLTIVKDLTRVMCRLKADVSQSGRFSVPDGTSTISVIVPSGWERSRRRACAVGPSTSANNWTYCNPCASKRGENC